ncbi:MAG TPA: redoxin domain-containing protein, partial [Nitrolancea sp.]|nr:redoxin domain-containing protein [Nitrolancea sp.]
MSRRTGWIVALFLSCSIGPALADEAAPDRPISDFTLKDTAGQARRLADFADRDAVVVTFLGTECPIAKLYGPRLAQLAEKFPKVQFLAIDSNQQDTAEELAEYGRVHGIKFPLLKDPENAVADLFGAERTPEVFVLDRERHVVYRGRIDDQFGIDSLRDKPRESFLRQALEDLAEGRPVKLPRTEAVGCHIGRVREVDPNAKVTWSNQIALLFQKHCVECHRPGDIGPFDLTQYTDTVGWGPMISEVVRQQRMPPWHASDEFGKFRNRRGMSSDEKQLVYDWVTAGCPLGDAAAAPPPREFSTRWQLPRDPDVVLEMRKQPFTVPAEGTLEYQYFVVDPKFTEDKWIAAAEIVPGNRTVVHHAVAFIRPPDHTDFRGIGWVAGYVPG